MQYIYLILFLFFLSSANAANENNGDWSRSDRNTDKCDFIGNAKLNINYKTLKIKAKKWRWNDLAEYDEKFFKGKFRKNKKDIFMQSRGLGYKHVLEGMLYDDKIFLTFSSTHTEMNEKFGGCKFEFIKDQ